MGWARRQWHTATYHKPKGKYISKSGKLKANSQPGLKQMWWNAVFPEHERWRKSTWKGKRVLYSLLLWKKVTFKWFLVNFQSVSSFHEDSGKREVCGGNWPVDLYTAWEEFHPFLYPRFFHRYWMCQLEQPYLICVLAPSLEHRLSSLSHLKRSITKTSTTSLLAEVMSNTRSQSHRGCKHSLQINAFKTLSLSDIFHCPMC